MTITEPMTMATDYIVAIVAYIFHLRLRKSYLSTESFEAKYMSWAMVGTASAAIFGGSYHGFKLMLPDLLGKAMWLLTIHSLSFVAYSVLCSVASIYFDREKFQKLKRFFIGKLVLFIGISLFYSRFRLAIIDYGSSLFLFAILHGIMFTRTKRHASVWMLLAVFISFCAAAIQQLKIGFGPSFNHNDFYHVVQIIGLWAFTHGAIIPRTKNTHG